MHNWACVSEECGGGRLDLIGLFHTFRPQAYVYILCIMYVRNVPLYRPIYQSGYGCSKLANEFLGISIKLSTEVLTT